MRDNIQKEIPQIWTMNISKSNIKVFGVRAVIEKLKQDNADFLRTNKIFVDLGPK